MDHEFDKAYWDAHWHQATGDGGASTSASPPNPYLGRETAGLVPGTALDAGCGAGAEAIWLASRGWRVTGADVSPEALARAGERARGSDITGELRWVEADLSVWAPEELFDLVVSHYAHPAMPQLEFYDRISSWVALGGTLLIVGHLHTHDGGGAGHEHLPPAEASVTAASVGERLHPSQWDIATAEECRRTVTAPDGREVRLLDVVVRARRLR